MVKLLLSMAISFSLVEAQNITQFSAVNGKCLFLSLLKNLFYQYFQTPFLKPFTPQHQYADSL